jgi:hypothetical protein
MSGKTPLCRLCPAVPKWLLNGLVFMKRITAFVPFAVFVFLAGSSTAIAEQRNNTGPVRLNTPRGQTPVVIRSIQENRISKQIRPAPSEGDVGAGQDEPQQRLRTDRPPLTGVEHLPSSGLQQVRPRAVHREVARRINIAGGVLVLPVVVYHGVPVILNVPELGYVDVPEDEYARLYDKLSSSDPEQVQEAMSSLRKRGAGGEVRWALSQPKVRSGHYRELADVRAHTHTHTHTHTTSQNGSTAALARLRHSIALSPIA